LDDLMPVGPDAVQEARRDLVNEAIEYVRTGLAGRVLLNLRGNSDA
jgi:hypothetical protein